MRMRMPRIIQPSAAAALSLSLSLCFSAARAEDDEDAPAPSNPEVTSPAATPEPAELTRGIDAVLARSYFGLDTAALLAKVQEKLKWVDKDERLLEAEAVLLWDRGEWRAALVDLQRLSRPGARAMAMLGEGLERKQETYEAAAYYLEAARAFPEGDTLSPAMYRKYLALRPNDSKAELEAAARLESQKRYLEAADIYARRLDLLPTDAQTALRIGAIFTGLDRPKDALALYTRARAANPSDRALAMRLADLHAASGDKPEAAADFAAAWEANPSDTVSRNKAVAVLEAMGPSGEAVLMTLLGKAVQRDGSAHALRFKLAEACLRTGDRDCAYGNLAQALQASPGNPDYLARLPDAIESDDQIKEQFPALKNMYETRGASMNLLQLVARGYGLTGDRPGACKAWYQLNGISPKSLEGRRGPVVDLAACDDPLYVSLAGRLGEKLPADLGGREIDRIIIRGALLDGDLPKAAELARRLAATPEEAPFVLQTAKDLLSRSRSSEAKTVLAELVKKVPSPEAYLLLGKILYAEKNCAEASDPLEAAASDYAEAESLLGECLIELKDFTGAARIYESLWSRKGDKESLVALANAYREAGYGPKEKEILATLVDKKWAGEAELLRLGALDAQQGDTARAEAVFTDLLKNRTVLPQDPAWIEAAFLVGNSQARAAKHDKAIRTLALALKADSSRVLSWELLGDCLAAKLRWREATATYAVAAALDRNSQQLAQKELDAARKSGDPRALVQAYLDVARFDSAGDEAPLFLAAHFQSQKDYREAAFYYRKLTAAHPRDAKSWENLGNCLSLIPDLEAAAEPLQNALDLGAQGDEVFINRARAYRREGAKDMAASILEFLVTRNPSDYLALLWSAKFAEEDGRQAEALELFKKAARQRIPVTSWPELASQGMQEAQAAAPVP